MDWLAILFLLCFGILMIVVELLFIPGTTIFGIVGVLSLASGVFYAFEVFGQNIGIIVLLSSVFLTGVAVLFSLRGKSWDRLSLKGNSDSRNNEGLKFDLKKGQIGKTISYLRPSGKAEFENVVWEVFAHDDSIESDVEVEITNIVNRKIFVKPIMK